MSLYLFFWREQSARFLTSSVTISRVVEFSKPEEAQRAIRELSDQQLLGRPIFIREVRLLTRSSLPQNPLTESS